MYTKNALNKHKATFILTEGIALIIHPFQRLIVPLICMSVKKSQGQGIESFTCPITLPINVGCRTRGNFEIHSLWLSPL